MSHSEHKNDLPDLSQPELTVLRPLWRKPMQSVREVHDQVEPQTGWAYTTTKTVMDRMVGKGLLERAQEKGRIVYSALISKPAGLARMVRFFADRVLETDGLAVVNMFKGTGTLSDEEMDELKRLIDNDAFQSGEGENK